MTNVDLAISRSRTQFHGYWYQCRECDADATAVAAIDHADDCPVTQPDDVTTPFTEDTGVFLQRFLDEAFWLRDQHEYVDDIEADVREKDGVRWIGSGSTARFAVGLGRTSPRGHFHMEDQRGIVLKFDPNIRLNTDHTPVSTNLDELFTWRQARTTETTQFFADILACARDGAWLVMEYCIPIQLKRTDEMNHRDILYDSGGTEYVQPLRKAAYQAGWVDADFKHGNIGLTDEGVPVFLDFGTGPRYDPEAVRDTIETADE